MTILCLVTEHPGTPVNVPPQQPGTLVNVTPQQEDAVSLTATRRCRGNPPHPLSLWFHHDCRPERQHNALLAMKKDDLKCVLRVIHRPVSGRKEELVARIKEAALSKPASVQAAMRHLGVLGPGIRNGATPSSVAALAAATAAFHQWSVPAYRRKFAACDALLTARNQHQHLIPCLLETSQADGRRARQYPVIVCERSRVPPSAKAPLAAAGLWRTLWPHACVGHPRPSPRYPGRAAPWICRISLPERLRRAVPADTH